MVKLNRKPCYRRIFDVFFSIFAIMLLVLIAANIAFPNGLTPIFGIGIYRIETASMEPVLMVNDYIVAEKVTVAELQADDIIVFKTKAQLTGAPITEEVIVIHYFGYVDIDGHIYTYRHDHYNYLESDPLKYDTWGTETTPFFVTSDDLIGRHIKTIESASLINGLMSFFTTSWPYLSIAVLGGGISVAYFLTKKTKQPQNKR